MIFNDIRVQSAGALLKANKIKRNQHGSKPRFKKSITAQVINIISCRLYSRNFVLLLSCFDNSRRKTNLSVDLEFPGCYCCASFYGFVIDLRWGRLIKFTQIYRGKVSKTPFEWQCVVQHNTNRRKTKWNAGATTSYYEVWQISDYFLRKYHKIVCAIMAVISGWICSYT